MKDIYFVSYERSDGEYLTATIESHCRIAALHDIALHEASTGYEMVRGTAELLCPSHLLAH